MMTEDKGKLLNNSQTHEGETAKRQEIGCLMVHLQFEQDRMQSIYNLIKEHRYYRLKNR